MAHEKRGVLLTCDPAIKQFLIYLNRERPEKFIKEDLDDTHLLVTDTVLSYLQEEIDKHHDANTFVKPKGTK